MDKSNTSKDYPFVSFQTMTKIHKFNEKKDGNTLTKKNKKKDYTYKPMIFAFFERTIKIFAYLCEHESLTHYIITYTHKH